MKPVIMQNRETEYLPKRQERSHIQREIFWRKQWDWLSICSKVHKSASYISRSINHYQEGRRLFTCLEEGRRKQQKRYTGRYRYMIKAFMVNKLSKNFLGPASTSSG